MFFYLPLSCKEHKEKTSFFIDFSHFIFEHNNTDVISLVALKNIFCEVIKVLTTSNKNVSKNFETFF